MFYKTLCFCSVLLSLGNSNPIIGGKDVGGRLPLSDSNILVLGQDQFPFMAHISTFTQVINNGISTVTIGTCGGVIIANHAVLTAAHCITDSVSRPSIFVRAGMVDFSLESLTAPASWDNGYVKNEGFVDHLNVTDNLTLAFMGDIAIIWLKTPFRFGQNIQPANLSTFSGPYPNESGWIIGWGDKINGMPQDMLQKAQTRIISNKDCQAKYANVLILPDMFCLLSDSKTTSSSCGDSGGPFVVGGTIYGLASFDGFDSTGKILCNTGIPVVFTHVGMYSDWIKEKLQHGPQCMPGSPSCSSNTYTYEISNNEGNSTSKNLSKPFIDCGLKRKRKS